MAGQLRDPFFPSELLQDGDQRIQELFDARRSEEMVAVEGMWLKHQELNRESLGLDEAKQAKRRTVGGS